MAKTYDSSTAANTAKFVPNANYIEQSVAVPNIPLPLAVHTITLAYSILTFLIDFYGPYDKIPDSIRLPLCKKCGLSDSQLSEMLRSSPRPMSLDTFLRKSLARHPNLIMELDSQNTYQCPGDRD